MATFLSKLAQEALRPGNLAKFSTAVEVSGVQLPKSKKDEDIDPTKLEVGDRTWLEIARKQKEQDDKMANEKWSPAQGR